MLHSNLRVGASPPNPFSMTSLAALGTGMVMVIGLWNFLLLGSKVTIGLKVALLPKTFLTNSLCIGWAFSKKKKKKRITISNSRFHFMYNLSLGASVMLVASSVEL